MGSSALAKLPIVHHSTYAMWQKWHMLPDKYLHYMVSRNDFYAPVFFFFFPSFSLLLLLSFFLKQRSMSINQSSNLSKKHLKLNTTNQNKQCRTRIKNKNTQKIARIEEPEI
ncbi:hypothetical protein ACJIZ3_008098 [Penstemon smallii]|uniref:Transmembrane protein n=1 Tax=Penstemon smallii TaxID=265156 RepID=A0ABD3TAI4_9LAMI